MSSIHQELITTTQVSHILGCSWRTVLRLVERDALEPAQKLAGIRGAYLFSPAEVERYQKAVK